MMNAGDTRRRRLAPRCSNNLKQLCLGKNTGPMAVADPNGQILTEPEEIARAQVNHWSKVFDKRWIDKNI